ncbi:hypothetical protein [Aquimarina algicola]|uniref:Uncharacterized protein n=1 Tax=Aquimarina algicola TaxID=2589995 RepID=A0A504JAR6_9FLAO|nr:hypothetical protein [Aquimarina algicola]TPN88046.1 hypothetical protein FHK87_10775 [Aquimarina algicola]
MKLFIEDTLQSISLLEDKKDMSFCLEQFKNLSQHPDSEIKLFVSEIDNYLACFRWISVDNWKIDCPVSLNKIHKQRYATEEECIQYIEQLYQDSDIDNIEDCIDVPIRHFTLDEMIEFKEEDEMMLQGQDPYQDESQMSSTNPKNKNIAEQKEKSDIKPKEIKPKTSKTEHPDKLKPKTEKVTKRDNSSVDDNSFFQI